MRQHIFLRLLLAVALLSAVVPLALDATAQPAQADPQAAFNQ